MHAPRPSFRWHYQRSLASRVALLTTLAVGLSVAAVALVGYVTVRMQMRSTLDESLLERAKAVAASGALADITKQVPIPSEALGAADIRIIFLDSERREARSADNLQSLDLGTPELDVATGRKPHSLRTIRDGAGERWRMVTVPSREGQAVVVAQSLEPQDLVLRKLGLVLTFFGIAGVITAGLAGLAVARNGLRPVRRLTHTVEEIARTEDLTPLEVEGHDEVARLAAAFNQMLTALSASRDRQRRLVADAGHELRTPLTSLRTNVDLLSQAGDGLPEAARAELLADVRAQTEELTTLVGDLVELARDEPIDHVVERVEMAEIVERAVARVRRRAPGATFDVAVEPWPVRGESGALERAVTNLLDNAAKWSPPDGTITVRLVDGVLTVDDQGPGIAAEDLPHVFERF